MDTYRISNTHGGACVEFDASDDAAAIRTFAELKLLRRTFLGWLPIADLAGVSPRLTPSARTEEA